MTPVLYLPSSPETHGVGRRWLGTRSYWLCQGIGWGGLFVVQSIPWPAAPASQKFVIFYYFVMAVSGVGLSHLLRLALLHHLRRPLSWAALLARLVPWLMATGLAQTAILLTAVWLYPENPLFAQIQGREITLFVGSLTLAVPLFTIWTGFYLGFRYYRRYQEARLEQAALAAAVKEAELRALKAQVNPHFLFNSLNALRALIPRDLAAPREALTLLSELLRSMLSMGRHETIPLSRELETVDCYLALEKLRFEARLRVSRDVEPAALAWPVPPFVLQTLVENAVKYGIGARETGGVVALTAVLRDGGLHLGVTNPGLLAATGTSTGLGLDNVRARFQLLYGPAATVRLLQAGPDLVVAELFIPAAPSRR